MAPMDLYIWMSLDSLMKQPKVKELRPTNT